VSDEDIRRRLLLFLQEITPPSAPPPGPDTPIFATGLFDSLALVQLVLWVEEAVGAPIDPSAFDMQEEWATVADLAGFIERGRAATGPSTGGVPKR